MDTNGHELATIRVLSRLKEFASISRRFYQEEAKQAVRISDLDSFYTNFRASRELGLPKMELACLGNTSSEYAGYNNNPSLKVCQRLALMGYLCGGGALSSWQFSPAW